MASSYTVTLSWTSYPHQELVTFITVKRDGVQIAVLAADATGFVDSGQTVQGDVLPNTTYQYEIDVLFNNGCPTRAALTDVDVGCYALPITGIGAAVDLVDTTTINVAWSAADFPLLKFVLSYGTTMGGPYTTDVDISPTSFAHFTIGLDPNTTYYFVVRAFDSPGCAGDLSDEVNATTGGAAQDFEIDWTGSGNLPDLAGLFAFIDPSNNMAGLTSLTIDDITNTQSYDYELCNDLVTLSFPSLAAISGNSYFFVFSCNSLTTVSLPSLTSHSVTGGGSFAIQDNPALTSVSLPLLATCNEKLQISGSPLLVVLSLPSLVPANGKDLIFSNNALDAASVNGILARAVANAGYVSGTVDTSGGTNAAPSGQGIVDAGILTVRGVTVITN